MIAIPRLPNESVRPYRALCAFAYAGLQRSLPLLARRQGLALSTLRSWSRRFRWRVRLDAFDLATVEQERLAYAEASKAQVQDWALRQAVVRENEYAVAMQIFHRVRQLLNNPRIRYTAADLVALLDLASRLGRLACESVNTKPVPDKDPWPDVVRRIERVYGKVQGKEIQLSAQTQPTASSQNTVS